MLRLSVMVAVAANEGQVIGMRSMPGIRQTVAQWTANANRCRSCTG